MDVVREFWQHMWYGERSILLVQIDGRYKQWVFPIAPKCCCETAGIPVLAQGSPLAENPGTVLCERFYHLTPTIPPRLAHTLLFDKWRYTIYVATITLEQHRLLKQNHELYEGQVTEGFSDIYSFCLFVAGKPIKCSHAMLRETLVRLCKDMS